MATESEYLTEFIAGAVFVLTIYPIAKDYWTEDIAIFWKPFLTSGLLAFVFVKIGVHLYNKQLKK